eukprot:1685952-Pyramimonas_sp.AAC.1
MEGSATEALCAICRGVGLIAVEFHYALAGDQESLDRHEDILRGANGLRDFREELQPRHGDDCEQCGCRNSDTSGQPASSANAGLVPEATTPAGAPPVDTPTPLIAETANNAGGPATSAPPSVPVNDTWLR